MTLQIKEKKQGIIAGISLIIMAVAAGFSYGYVHNGMLADTPEATLQNLINNQSLYIAGLSGWVIIFITDLIVTVALYKLFAGTSRVASLVTAVLRFTYTIILGLAIFQLFKIIPLLNMAGGVQNTTVSGDVTSRIQLFEKIWSSGLVIFGLHLAGLGYLSLKSRFIPGILGYLLYLGGVLYFLLSGLKQLSVVDPNVLAKAENLLSLPMALGEMLLAFWLIFKGFKKG